MKVKVVPVLSDNYAYLLIAKDGTTAAVDPVEPSKVISAAEGEGVKVDCVLTTHHHWCEQTLCSSLCSIAAISRCYRDAPSVLYRNIQDDAFLARSYMQGSCWGQ